MSLAILIFASGCEGLPERSEFFAPDENSGTIRGRVTLDGEPVAGVTVDFGNKLVGGSATTDADGNYSVTLIRGEYSAVVLSRFPGAVCPTGTVRVRIDQETTANFSCQKLEGTYEVRYETTATSCEASLPPFTVEATATTEIMGEDTEVAFSFADAPAPILGLYHAGTATYTGETPFVDIGNGLTAKESWDTELDFQFGADFQLTGTSSVAVMAGAAPVCDRGFIITASRAAFSF